MLGAQTRAAEYNAAKKAQARQASREAEEQKVPPPTAPVSLGAFTRPVANRNKGIKTYVPLVLEATPEANRVAEENDLTETPTKRPSTTTPSSRTSSSRHGGINGTDLQRTAVIGGNPPSAPRSMINGRLDVFQTTPVFSRPQTVSAYHHNPPHVQQQVLFPPQYPFQYGIPPPLVPPPDFTWASQQSFMNRPYPFPPASLHHQPQPQQQSRPPPQSQLLAPGFDSPAPTARQTAPPRSEPLPRRPLEIRNPSAEPVEQVSKETPRPKTPEGRYVFGPDDLSPTKQEMKMSIRRERIRAEIMHTHTNGNDLAPDDAAPILPDPIRLRNPASASKSSHHFTTENKITDPSTPSPRPKIFERYESQQSITSSLPRSLPNPLRQFHCIDELDEGSVTAIPWMKSGNIKENVLNADDDAHYDRATKMQKFVAVQQSLNKQGKTVLNNPERKHTASVVSQVPSIVIDGTGGPGPAMPEEQVRNLPSADLQPIHTSIYPPPGLERSEKPFIPVSEAEISMFEKNNEQQKRLGVRNADWFDLKPTTSADRKKMQDVIRDIRSNNFTQLPRLVADNDRWYTEEGRRQFIEDDSRWLPQARERIHRIANDYSMRLHATVGRTWPDHAEVDVHAGMIRGAGHMLVNLTEYLMDHKDKPNYFNRTKMVPDAAIDHESLAAGAVKISLFETDPRCPW